ncbi:hypothetical protein X975_09057, partial [Stegodyphus mimosarum]
MWALRPTYYDNNDMPIDLRKKVVLQRDLEEQKESRRTENAYAPKQNSANNYRERWHQPAALPVGNLYPFMSERYGVRCSLVSSEENKEKSHEFRSGSRGTLETAIRKLHHNKFKQAVDNPREERCRSTGALDNQEKNKRLRRSNSCPDLSNFKLKTPQSQYVPDCTEKTVSSEQKINSVNNIHQIHDIHVNAPIIGGAKKRKSFVPIYGDSREPSPKKLPKSPTEHSPYEEYSSHTEVLLRRQLQQQSTPPYLLHVYDYYQQLVQRLREHSSTTVRLHPPISPTPADDDLPSDAQRKRPCRALTGKHVRQGTGASISTLLTLRQKIQERQKAKEHQPRNVLNGTNKNICAKKSNPK